MASIEPTTGSPPHRLEATGLCKAFGGLQVTRDVSLALPAGARGAAGLHLRHKRNRCRADEDNTQKHFPETHGL